ncbi:hypothetical protein INT45_007127 [Circinella minor]|uniref:Uncharacterized protein n=1 Tax=Circinella minor TaxID=1195481 RepID=A0A8H7VG42_9FUNG|nr:hypothetical protein INT45_007127 [Circinella minor]
MALATFAVVIHRYKRCAFIVAEYEVYQNLAEYLPKEIFEQRMKTINNLVKEKYPNIYPETYMFSIAVILVIATAAFAILGRSLDISIWYPLAILIVPAMLGYGSTRRRSQYLRKFLSFQNMLDTCLKDMTTQDLTHHVKWGYRKLRECDTAHTLHLKRPLSSWTVSIVIEAIQMDPEMDTTRVIGEVLPSYAIATQDIVLDVGAPVQDTVVQLREMDLTDVPSITRSTHDRGHSPFLPPPPDYHETEPPPYNLNDRTTLNNNNNTSDMTTTTTNHNNTTTTTTTTTITQ